MNDEIDDEILEAELKDDALEKKMRKWRLMLRGYYINLMKCFGK